MHIIKPAPYMPVRKFECYCCGTVFAATAKEAIESGPAWSVDCPFCKHECRAYQGDELDQAEIELMKHETEKGG